MTPSFPGPAGSGQSQLSRLMYEFRCGRSSAAGELVDLLHTDLRRLAAIMMARERRDHTWQPTALVNELYLELAKIKGLRERPLKQEEKDAFLSLAAHIMRRLLIHHARPLAKRAVKQPLNAEMPEDRPGIQSLEYVDDLLNRLAEINPKFRAVVEMRVFEGQTQTEIAKTLGCSERTVSSYWNFARRWLENEMET